MTEPSAAELRDWLDGHVNLERGDLGTPAATRGRGAPTLDRMAALTGLLGDPQGAYPVVHVTGTNGKSSTARMAAALLTARGLSVGLYTSPHLVDVTERLAWNGEPVGEDDFAAQLDQVRRVEDEVLHATGSLPSYFEIVTAAAFSWFADVAVDVAVIEVGMGGMWDATNVADADVAVVTNVAIDHVEYLGPTRDAIAKEKAGIVKDESVLVLGETDPDLQGHFTASAPETVYRRGEHFAVLDNRLAHNGRLLTLRAPSGVYDDVFLSVHGAHQGENAACALAAAEAFFGGEAFSDDVIGAAYGSLELPGRLEVVGRQPLVILDGAHNAEGARALQAALDEEFPTGGRTLLVGLLREKDPAEMLEALGVPGVERVIVCRPPTPRAHEPADVAAAAIGLGVPEAAVEVAGEVPEAVARALATTPPDGQVVVSGSLYTVGAARSVLVAS